MVNFSNKEWTSYCKMNLTPNTNLENGYRLQIKIATVAFEKWKPMAYTGAMTCGRGLGMDFFYPE
jgi:hypothetical protein